MSIITYPGLFRFEYFLAILEEKLRQAAEHKNPALWLYSNDARTPLFMLEGLAKLYAGLHNKKKFDKLKVHFKNLEDLIGAVDYYDNSAKGLSENKKIPTAVIKYLQAQTREKLQGLNELLVEKKWIGATTGRMQKIRTKLKEVNWLKSEKEVVAFGDFYGEAIYEIISFAKDKNYVFSNMESDVHEMRRKLRWLSIYPQALRGSIQMDNREKNAKYLQKYLTKEILQSPFNQFPAAAPGQDILLLRKGTFLALSWMISELGRIKDSGLKLIALTEALQQTTTLSEAGALKKAEQLVGSNYPKIPLLLSQATAICKQFIEEHNLEQLVMGPGKQ